MFIGLGMVKGAALGMLYTVIVGPLFALFYFQGLSLVDALLPMVAVCAVPAGALVGAAVVATGAYQPGRVWRAQLAMVLIYVLTGIVFLGGLHAESVVKALGMAAGFSPLFIPSGLGATWLAVRWIRPGR
ncbi:hypothetical protein ACLESD_05790 [Pyxidicoccus sp. 3LFB2]